MNRMEVAMDAIVEAPHYIDGLRDFERITRRWKAPTQALALHVANICRDEQCKREGRCSLCPGPRQTKRGACLKCARRIARKRKQT